MTQPVTPDITVDVDLRNPGQFFACCGLLELASRLWPASADNGWREPEGWFEKRHFHVTTYSRSNGQPLQEMLQWLLVRGHVVKLSDSEMKYDDKVYPVAFTTKSPLILDWWLDKPWSKDASEFKLWAAHQHPLQIVAELQEGLAETISAGGNTNCSRLFSLKTPMTTRFGFDHVAAWTPLDVGFAPNEHSHLKRTLTSPAIELLAAIGIQGCRPRAHPKVRRRFIYSVWPLPLPVLAARAFVDGRVETGKNCSEKKNFDFEIAQRGRFKAFSRAQLFKEGNYDDR